MQRHAVKAVTRVYEKASRLGAHGTAGVDRRGPALSAPKSTQSFVQIKNYWPSLGWLTAFLLCAE
jgi:hypothetical protein